MQPVTEVTLEGRLVRLLPLRLEHVDPLFAAAQDPEIWRYMLADLSISREAMRAAIAAALDEQAAGRGLPFVVIDRTSGAILGTTRYFDVKPHERGLEIGYSWLGAGARRTGVNTECKYLLLRHAFEVLGAIRVQLKTDVRNLVSQRAIERIGATREGTLRKYQIRSDGYQRDTALYSIIDDEWPRVKAHLEGMMARG